MYKRMLVPLDSSTLAEVVLPYAQELALSMSLDIMLLNVHKPEEREYLPTRKAYIEHMAETLRKQLSMETADKLITVSGEMVIGTAADEILRYVTDKQADLVLMATHGRSGLKRIVMGSVADQVLRASKIPVCLVRPWSKENVVYHKGAKSTMLVPLDGSELAEAILPHVDTLARQCGSGVLEIVLMRVCKPAVSSSYYFPEMTLSWEEYVEQQTATQKKEAEAYLAALEKRLKDSGLTVRSVVFIGNPADEIANYVNKNPVNFIVMSTHARTGISRWAYGSVAEKLLLNTSKMLCLVRSG
jgi:nucleotide-binding universal stress UspA family protein